MVVGGWWMVVGGWWISRFQGLGRKRPPVHPSPSTIHHSLIQIGINLKLTHRSLECLGDGNSLLE